MEEVLEALEEVLEVVEVVPEEVLVPVFPVGSPWDAKKWLGEKPNFCNPVLPRPRRK